MAFQHPLDWVVQPDTSEFADPCSYLIQPLARDSLLIETDSIDLHTIFLQVIPESPEVAGPLAGFERRGNDWAILGRMGVEAPGASYSRDGMTGVTGSAAAGCYRLNGGYAGVCDSPAALVGTDTRSVAVRGGPQSEDVIDQVVRTLDLTE